MIGIDYSSWQPAYNLVKIESIPDQHLSYGVGWNLFLNKAFT